MIILGPKSCFEGLLNWLRPSHLWEVIPYVTITHLPSLLDFPKYHFARVKGVEDIPFWENERFLLAWHMWEVSGEGWT